MRIETAGYKAAHKKSPAGFGGWAFEFPTTGGLIVAQAPAPMAYNDAKIWALLHARTLPMTGDQIFVAP
jgi:hypothetical protein